MSRPLRFGIIGGGLMGKEMASALGRWFALDPSPGEARLTAVCDTNATARDWFRRVPGVTGFYDDHRQMLASGDVDAVYVAVPHSLHKAIYSDVLEAGLDLLAEKPFGIDLAAAESLVAVAERTQRFVRVSSEFPFFPGAQAAYRYVAERRLGHALEIRSAFLHSSDLDPDKPINWKRQSATCGTIGVLGDLGMHVTHLPFRLGIRPNRVSAVLQSIYPDRPDGQGGRAICDTWDNATLTTWCDGVPGTEAEVPVTFETKRMAPGEMNTWLFEALGTDGGVRFSTRNPKTLWTYERGKSPQWIQTEFGHTPPFSVITGGIFEFGFPDSLLQLLAAFVAERNGALGDRFGCARPEEALLSHRLFEAALRSHELQRTVEVSG
ncbi:MAG: gfo/Idh/MocA family oxidoreductase [Armatimonadota bacterium]